ncbi:MAG: Asp-tRNA(Asn)/Glu-tRNA(Gln) amidotransferase subunit GatC [Candidatus Jidaibacter sp.]|jgi:aspartyl-tRNA(Asn)/glutamyl-tRNA(Gln) amidotransferase subunit C|nr:Asp-tRNA(Asn)/Glu-tRNA(Gln) amidotransferase subunit GatC [Candidatus Jidaibacter sp.]
MSLTKENVKKIASLAKFKLSDAEVEKYCGELNKIFSWIDALNEVDTSNVDALNAVNSQYTSMRPDVVTDGNIRDAILSNSAHSKYGYFVVPKVIE